MNYYLTFISINVSIMMILILKASRWKGAIDYKSHILNILSFMLSSSPRLINFYVHTRNLLMLQKVLGIILVHSV